MSRIISTVGHSRYLVASNPIISFGNILLPDSEIGFEQHLQQRLPVPATIIIIEALDSVSSSWLRATIDTMLASDDVFSEHYLSSVLFLSSTEGKIANLDEDAKGLLDSWGSSIISVCYPGSLDVLRSGPYFLIGLDVHMVSRLYPDPYGAFLYGVVQSEDDKERYERVMTDLIPVPSRLYFASPNELKPLSGKRLAVKDIYDVRGLKTSMCCKSYEACHGESSQTADAIQKLLGLGAVIVAKAKTVQLASGLGPRDWIDYQCPFNPRGDGYLTPDCSSTGSAAGMAAYDWLDFSIGSDSLGSMVGPAAANGIFGLRPTQGVLPLGGSLLVSTLLDTPGHFSRNISDLGMFAGAWFGQGELEFIKRVNKKNSPVKIMFPVDSFASYPRAKLDVMESFIEDLEKTVGSQRKAFNIESVWKEKGPVNASNLIHDFLATSLAHIQLYDCYHNNARFRGKYEAEYGFSPYVEPMIQYKWDLGAKLTREDYNQACDEKAVFQRFLRECIIPEGAVMLLPGGDPEISYRDEYVGSPAEFGRKFQGFGFKNTTYSVLGGCPCVSFPVGQTMYHSKITKKGEFEPVSLMLVGPPGWDMNLIDLIEQVLESSGRPQSVKVGKTAF